MTNSTPADELCLQILEREEMEAFVDTLNFVGDVGHGRIRAMQWQAIFQLLLISRRSMCQDAGLNFYEVEMRATTSVRRFYKKPDELSWLLVYLATRKICIPQSSTETWDYARSTIRSWPVSQ